MPEATETTPTQEGYKPGSFFKQMGEAVKNAPDNPQNKDKQPEAKTEPAKTETVPEKKVEAAPVTTAPDPEAAIDAEIAEIRQNKRTPSSKHFDRLTKKLEKSEEGYKAKLSEYESKLKELEKRPKHNANEIEALAKERDELKHFQETVALEWSPAFNQKYKARTDAAVAKLSGLDNDTKAKLTAILSSPDSPYKTKALDEIMENMTPSQIARVGAVDAEFAGIMAERQAELSQSQESLTKIAQQHQEANKANLEKRQTVFKTFAEKAKAENPMFRYREGEGSKEWNAAVDERLAVAESIFNGQYDNEDLADVATRASSYHVVVGENQRLSKELASAKEVIAKLQSGSPDLGTGGSNGEGQRPHQIGDFSRQIGAAIKQHGKTS